MLSNAQGSVTDQFAYDAFGNLLARTGTTPTLFLFNGQALDSQSALYYLRGPILRPADRPIHDQGFVRR